MYRDEDNFAFDAEERVDVHAEFHVLAQRIAGYDGTGAGRIDESATIKRVRPPDRSPSRALQCPKMTSLTTDFSSPAQKNSRTIRTIE